MMNKSQYSPTTIVIARADIAAMARELAALESKAEGGRTLERRSLGAKAEFHRARKGEGAQTPFRNGKRVTP